MNSYTHHMTAWVQNDNSIVNCANFSPPPIRLHTPVSFTLHPQLSTESLTISSANYRIVTTTGRPQQLPTHFHVSLGTFLMCKIKFQTYYPPPTYLQWVSPSLWATSPWVVELSPPVRARNHNFFDTMLFKLVDCCRSNNNQGTHCWLVQFQTDDYLTGGW